MGKIMPRGLDCAVSMSQPGHTADQNTIHLCCALVAATDVAAAPGYYITGAAVLVLMLLLVARFPESRGHLG